MEAFQRVLRDPGSLAARRRLAAVWHAAYDPRAALIDDQLALDEARAPNASTC